jgi:hypothetical protein
VEHGPAALEHPESEAIADLTELALDKSTALQSPARSVSSKSESILDLVELPEVAA